MNDRCIVILFYEDGHSDSFPQTKEEAKKLVDCITDATCKFILIQGMYVRPETIIRFKVQ